jgi:signal transduction histidine kinase
MRAPRGRLVRKLLLATVLPAVAVLAVFGALAHELGRRELEDELGKRLAMAAAATALFVLPETIAALGPGQEGGETYLGLRHRLERTRAQFDLRRVLVVARDRTGRADTAGLVALGAPAHELGADAPEMERAAQGKPTASPLFAGRDGRAYKRAYARVGDPAAGFVVVEGSADYFVALATFRRWLLAGGAAGAGLIVALSLLVAARITGPLGRLAAAADRIGRGDLAGAVPVETADELGFLAGRLDEMRAALAARDERLQMMLAGIAHEVRNPLGGLRLYAGLLREGVVGQPERLEEVGRIEREVGHLETVVSDFLEYARRPAPRPERVEARALLDEVAEISRPPDGGARMRVDASAGLAASADRGQLRRALLNLARNAVSAAGATGEVVLAARADGGRVLWEVRDSGPGVPEDLRDKVFTPFFTTREKGTGLGLAFVRDIARDHGGEVAVDRAPEGGARFRFDTPATE